MPPTTRHDSDLPTAEVGAYPALLSRVSWGAIIAGTVCAIAIHLLLGMIGLSVGFAVIDPAQDAEPLSGIATGAGIWWAISSLIALFVGGAIAARMAGIPRSAAGMLHGATVWALVTVLTTWMATTGVTRAIGGASSAVVQAGQLVTQAGENIIPDNISAADLSIDDLNSLLPGVNLEHRIEIFTAEDRRRQAQRGIRQEAREIVNRVISQQEQQRAAELAQDTTASILTSPRNAQQDLERLFDRMFGGSEAVFSQEDRAELVNVLETRLNVPEQEAEQIANNWVQSYQAVAREAEQAWTQARQEVTQLAQNATNVLAQASGWSAFALVLGLLAASAGGIFGRPEQAALLWPLWPDRDRDS